MKKIIKKFFIFIGVLLLAFALLIAYIVVKDFKQEEILQKEVIILANKDLLKDDFDVDIKTTGEYAYVEETIKKYYRDLSYNVKTFNSYMDNDDLIDILSVNNLENDRKGFVKSRKTLKDSKEKIVGSLNNISKLCDEDTIKNLLDKEKVSDYTIKFYHKIMYTKEDLKEINDVKKQMEKLAKDYNDFLNKIEEIINLLDDNNDSWFIRDGQLYFSSNDLVDRYNKLYKELTTMVDDNSKNNSYKKSGGSGSSI